LINQFIARAIDYKNRQKPDKALKAEDKPNKKPNDKTKPNISSTLREESILSQRFSTQSLKADRKEYNN
jgi:hypothetical protein